MKFTKPYQSAATIGSVTVVDAKNVYYEPDGVGGFIIRRRPGLAPTLSNNGEPNGIHVFEKKLYSVSENKLNKHDYPDNITYIGDIGGSGVAEFENGQKLDTTPFFYIARNFATQYYDGAINTPTDAPIASTISLLGSRFWANNTFYNDQDFYITGVEPISGELDPFYWGDATNPWRATQNSDKIVKIVSAWGESYIFGEESCEIWQEDGINPISPIVGATIEVGLLAKDSVVKGDNTLFLLALVDGKRCVIKLQGRTPVVVSEPISDIISGMDTVSDAIGSTCFSGGTNFYILKFPTEQRTFCYDFKTDVWTEWAGWGNGEWADFVGHGMVYAPAWNKTIVQTEDGLSEIRRDTYTDNGETMRSSITTGVIDHGTPERKRCDGLIIKVKAYSGNPDTLIFRYRDNGRPEWSNYIEIPLSAQSETEYYAKIHRLGIYRSRQYEFVLSDNADLALVGFDEDIKVIR